MSDLWIGSDEDISGLEAVREEFAQRARDFFAAEHPNWKMDAIWFLGHQVTDMAIEIAQLRARLAQEAE